MVPLGGQTMWIAASRRRFGRTLGAESFDQNGNQRRDWGETTTRRGKKMGDSDSVCVARPKRRRLERTPKHGLGFATEVAGQEFEQVFGQGVGSGEVKDVAIDGGDAWCGVDVGWTPSSVRI